MSETSKAVGHTRSASCDFEFENGEVEISERTERNPEATAAGMYDTIQLVAMLDETVHFSIDRDTRTDDNGDRWENFLTVRTDVFHVENEETKRAFHSHVTFHMPLAHAAQLRDFLTLLLEWRANEERANDR